MYSDTDSGEETPVIYTAIAGAAAAAAIKVTGILEGQMMDASSDEYFTEEDASSQSSDDAHEQDSDTKYDKKGNRRVPLLSDWPALPSPAASRRMAIEQGVRKFHHSQAELQKSIAGVKRTQAMTAASAAADGEHATKRAKTIASVGPALDAVAIHPVRLTPRRTKSKHRQELMEVTCDRVTRILDQCTGIMKSIEKEMRDPVQLVTTDVKDIFGPELVPFGLKSIATEFRETRMDEMYMRFLLPKKRAHLRSQGLVVPPREFIIKKAVADVWSNFEDRLMPDGLEIACRSLMKPGMAEMYLVYPLAAKRAYLEREGVLRGPRTVQKPLDQYVTPSGGEGKGRVHAAATLPPALLQRARNIAKEHDALAAALEADYDSKTARRVGELSSVVTALREWEKAQSSIAELDGLLYSKDKELREMAAEELQATNGQLSSLSRKLSASLTPKDPYAHMPCLLELRPGPGGLEGRFFADTLFKMYKGYCARKGLRANVIKYDMADAAGDSSSAAGESPLQEAVIEVQDPGAYDLFRGEAGMHRVQRIPATESKGRVHTSAVAVWVLPSFQGDNGGDMEDINNPESDFFIDPSEVKIETMRARGAGGQHVNKTESAIRMTHIPTGTVVSMQDSRSQSRNRDDAWKLIRSRVALQRREAREEAAAQLRNSVLSKHKITRGDKIRTYNYNQDRVTDHRAGIDVHNLPDVIAGGESLDKIVDEVRDWLVSGDIEAMMADESAANAEAKKAQK
ncbi:RF-1 domain-containing protein [Colletotrichum scovillei]|uniref:RF-1 domain-containing protein n=1 Tax=Colletotrichum scovillei TaxID=1209932 RepID=A0A9P7RFE7_9PEZI|nr:RF-1 domain-containing protein [Colletotrichum scovillei]KAG7074062.1 RF-1 domain-containing protein [Colletotrichum scovillei]KAG7081402.1 RF-1 domain-containing protein [Colletotrichum scovillei]